MRIEKLTAEQEALFPAIREEWLAIGLSTELADRPRAEAAVDLAYAAGGLAPPQRKLWAQSPIEGARLAAELANTQIPDVVGASFGQHDGGWLSFYAAFGRFGIDVHRLDGLFELAKSCGWWWAFGDVVVLTERPNHLSRDDRGRLHCETGAAIRWPDGWGVYAWHGVRVPEDVILRPHDLSVERIEKETNVEIRRVMIERYGVSRYVSDSGAEAIAEDSCGVLYRKEVPGDEAIVMVKVLNSTPEPDGSRKTYFLRVPPNMRTPHEAVAWSFNVPPDRYKPETET